jgi:hypothetical protein
MQVMKRHMDAVVKVFATHSKPNFTLPWQRQQQLTSKSTGEGRAGGLLPETHLLGEPLSPHSQHSVSHHISAAGAV